MNVLVLNAGSSRLKFQVIATDLERIRQDADERLWNGSAVRPSSRLKHGTARGKSHGSYS
jgi:acetate kinase